MQSGPPISTIRQHSHARGLTGRLQIVVMGYIVRGPIGGMAWHHLNYVLGLKQLGHDVLFLEDSDDYPSCYDPSTHQVGYDPTYGLSFAAKAFERLGLGACWAYHDTHQNAWHGPAGEGAVKACENADLLLNVSGVNPIRDWQQSIPIRAFVDTDPAFTQIRHLNDLRARGRAEQHNRFFTFAESIGLPQCEVPHDGFPWQPTRQPVALDAWPAANGPPSRGFTTVMQWDSYPRLEFGGRRFGMKSESFELIRDLPAHSAVPLEIALGGDKAPREELRQSGWHIAEPLAVTRDPWTYQEYLQTSLGELSVAKNGYVVSRSGWFSERTACYLTAGRPAVVQDTGFSQHLPCGDGLWAFHNLESALDGLTNVTIGYAKQCQAARELAAEYFDSNKVLSKLLDSAFSTDEASGVI